MRAIKPWELELWRMTWEMGRDWKGGVCRDLSFEQFIDRIVRHEGTGGHGGGGRAARRRGRNSAFKRASMFRRLGWRRIRLASGDVWVKP